MMAALNPGSVAPDFALPQMGGGGFRLKEALSRGPVVVVFFKISCPTCQYALPFLERIHQAYAGQKVAMVGVSQNDTKDTALFQETFGITFPVLLDDAVTYPVSNAYGLTHVPTVFWIAQQGDIQISSVGWDRGDIAQINAKVAEADHGKVVPVFHSAENVPAFRAG
jgi:peroxiredoxin